MSDLADLISDNNINMSDSADVNLGGVTMWDLQDVKPDVLVTLRDTTDVIPDVLVTLRDTTDVKPDVLVTLRGTTGVKPDVIVTLRDTIDVKLDANLTMVDLEDAKPDVNMTTAVEPNSCMTTSALEGVKPVVKREEPHSLEDENACIEALRSAVLLQEENIRQRGSFPSVSAANTDVDKSTRSLEADCYKDEDQPSLISGTTSSKAEERSAYPSPSHNLDCTDIKEEKTENCEPYIHAEGTEISERHGVETINAILKEDIEVFNSQDSGSQTSQVAPKHCEPDTVSDVEQAGQSDVTPGQFGYLWGPNIYLTDRQRHMKQVHSDEYSKVSLENGWQHVTISHQQSGPSVAFLESSVTSGLIKKPVNKTDLQLSETTLNYGLIQEISKIDGQPIDTKKNSLSNSGSLIFEQLCLAKNSIDEGKGTHSSETWSSEEGQSRFCMHTHTLKKPSKGDMFGKVFDRSSNLLSRIRVCTGKKPDVDGNNFGNGHKTTHTGGKPYTCGVFGKDFADNSTLVTHKRTHTGGMPFKCDVCGKDFARRSRLVTHKTIHTGEKPYKCDVCGKDFRQIGDLVDHKRVHTGERPFRCDVCGKDFTRRSNLASHKRTHTYGKQYKCDVCAKDFAQKGNLVDHKRTHTGEKPYKCDVCARDFARSSHLVIHKRTHAYERPYKCDVCGRDFKHRPNLVRHKRAHAG